MPLSCGDSQNFPSLLLTWGVPPPSSQPCSLPPVEHGHLPPPSSWKMPAGCESSSGEEGRVSLQSQSRFGTAAQPLGLPWVSPTLTLTPLLLTVYTAGISSTTGPSSFFVAFSSLMPPKPKMYHHRGPLWINDLLTALFTRGWGGGRSPRVRQWGRLELCSG